MLLLLVLPSCESPNSSLSSEEIDNISAICSDISSIYASITSRQSTNSKRTLVFSKGGLSGTWDNKGDYITADDYSGKLGKITGTTSRTSHYEADLVITDRNSRSITCYIEIWFNSAIGGVPLECTIKGTYNNKCFVFKKSIFRN